MLKINLSLIFCLVFGSMTPAIASNGIRGEGCGNNPERPYVCDIGAPRVLTPREFVEVVDKNEALRETVKRLGKPDRAEIQKVRVREPWSQWEVRTYYNDLDRMFVYGRAYILGSPVITILRHESTIPTTETALAPADLAAQSAAAQAAAAAERSAAAAEKTARLAQALADDAGEQFPQRLMKK